MTISRSHLYRVWEYLRAKITNPNHPRYNTHGALGIKHTPNWDKFQTFKIWAKESGYSKGDHLQRYDKLKDYCERNCFWVSPHGQNNTRLYSIWDAMKQRCGNQNDARYKDYGGRGITVCREWLQFTPFWRWSKLNGYSDKLTIDRKNNDEGYNPGNCHWATRSQQNQNRRKQKNCTSKYIGVSFNKQTQKWRAVIKPPNQKSLHLGYFEDEEEASDAYQKARKVYFKG